MSQELEEGRKGIFYSRLILSSLASTLFVVDGHSDQSPPGLLPADSGSQDGSNELFSMYMIGEKQDKETAEGWKADANVIFIFVSPCVTTRENTQSIIMS